RRRACSISSLMCETCKLLSEQRRAACLRGNGFDERFTFGGVRLLSENRFCDRSNRTSCERTKLDAHVIATTKTTRIVSPQRGSRRGENEDGMPHSTRKQVIEPCKRLEVSPLRILERDHERSSLGHTQRHVGQRNPQSVTCCTRIMRLGKRLIRNEPRD